MPAIPDYRSTASCRQRLLAHTADCGLALFAPDRAALYVTAAAGLALLTGVTPPPRPCEYRTVQVSGSDDGELLVAWLNELLYLCECRHFVPATVAIATLGATTLSATLCGERLDPARHSFARQAKAATYHRLLVRERHGRWQARIYIDL